MNFPKLLYFLLQHLFYFFTSHGRAACAFFVADWQSKQRKPKLQNLRNFSLLKTQTKITSSTLFTKKFNKNCEVNSNFHKKNVKVLSLKSEKKIIENFLFDLISIFFSSFSRSSYIRSDPDFFKFVLSFAFIFITITNFSSKTTSKTVWPEGGNFPALWDFWPKRGDRFLRMGNCGINSKRGGF